MSIFLAHCPADTALANTLVARLRAAGSDVFVEVAAEASEEVAATPLPAREATRRHVLQELIRRPVFVVIVSPAALDSAWVHDLCDWAYDLYQDEPSRMVVAVMLRSAAPTPTPAPQQPFPASSIYAFQRVEAPASDMEHDPEAAALLFERLSGALALLTPPGVASAAGGWENDLSWGMALATQERFAEALPYLQRAARHAPASFDAWFQLGQTLLRLRRDMEAVAALRRATELVPANAYAWNGMGRALLHARRDEEALEAYARALALYPHYTSALIGQGHALRHLGRLDAAMAVYQQVVQANPTEVSAHMGQGAALFAQARYQEAAAAYQQATAIDPTHAGAWSGLGYALDQAGRAGEAVEAFERASALSPDAASVWFWMGNALFHLKRYQEAVTAYEHALALNPLHVAAARVRAEALRDLENPGRLDEQTAERPRAPRSE